MNVNIMNKKSWILGFSFLALSNAAIAEIVVEKLTLTDKSRVSRFEFKYEFAVTVKNDGAAVENILLDVTSQNPASEVESGGLSLTQLGNQESAQLEGSLILIQDRRARFKQSDFVWRFQFKEIDDDIAQTFSENSAYHTGEYPNFFVEHGLATPEQSAQKLQSTYAQLFELVPDTIPSSGNEGDVQFYAGFEDENLTGWEAGGDNGTPASAALSIADEALVVTPTWQSSGDALFVKYRQFSAIDITAGATISYELEVADDYITDGSMAVQLVIEDANFNPGFFAYSAIAQNGRITVSVDNIGPETNYGYIAEGFDFTQLTGIGFQFLTNGKPVEVTGDIILDEVTISVPIMSVPDELVFFDEFNNGINNWSFSADNGSAVEGVLSEQQGSLNIAPTWASSADSFTVKYQQFDAVDITAGATISFDVKIPAAYINDANLITQLVIEDANYQPGFIGYASVSGRPADEFATFTFTDVGASANFGYISDSFDFTQLRGIGMQFIAGGKTIEIDGDIQVDNVKVILTGKQPEPVPQSNTTLLYGVGDDMAFIKAVDSNDIRSEGMSYGMFIAVMMDDQDTFKRLWRFTKDKMQNTSGPHDKFFAWRLSAVAPYAPLATNPAPDGEEYFAMALFMANNRWGSSTGIFDYKVEANAILHDMIYTKSDSTRYMMHPVYKQIEFVTTPNIDSFTDPSYHLPAFYELWALWADEDNDYWHEVAAISREYLTKAAHPVTGLFSDYASHEGAPQYTDFNSNSHKSAYDSYRVMGNLALDYYWISESAEMKELVDRQVDFFDNEVSSLGDFIAIYEVDGSREPGITYRGHGRTAMNGFGATASDKPFATDMLRYLWEQDAPTGLYRYYDGMLHMFSLLHASGEYKIYKPE